MMQKNRGVVVRAISDELYLLLFSERTAVRLEKEETERVRDKLLAREAEIRALQEAERERVEKRKAVWRFAGYLAVLCLFSSGCAISAAACLSYGPWWTAIAPVVLLLVGVRKALKN